MNKVTQTKVVVKNSKDEMVQRGNCMAACFASIMELPITDIPNIEVLFDTGIDWTHLLIDWFKANGWSYKFEPGFKIFHDEVYRMDNIDRQPFYENKYYLATGISPREIRHMAIYKNGILIHDPHPTKEGLIEIDEFWELKPIVQHA